MTSTHNPSINSVLHIINHERNAEITIYINKLAMNLQKFCKDTLIQGDYFIKQLLFVTFCSYSVMCVCVHVHVRARVFVCVRALHKFILILVVKHSLFDTQKLYLV
jgi:hypothetical protein